MTASRYVHKEAKRALRQRHRLAKSQVEWAMRNLIVGYVVTKTRQQIGTCVEFDECAKHDYLLPAGHTIPRPSLASEQGVVLFWQDDVPSLRHALAPRGTIDDLLVRLRNILRHNGVYVEDLELFAVESGAAVYPYSLGDGKCYMICARNKDRSDPAAPTAT